MIQLGAHFVTPYFGEDGTWSSQLDRFTHMRAQVGKMMIPTGFGTGPEHIQDLINRGAHTIILRTQDCDIGWERTRNDFVGRGFREVVLRNPDVRFVLEVGNEPELCQPKNDPFRGIDTYINEAREVGRNFHTIDAPNLELILSSPTKYNNYISVINAPDLMKYYDGFGVHAYGHYYLNDSGGGDWPRILDDVLKRQVDVWITEAGINDSGMDKAEKARRILEFTHKQPPLVQGIVVFTIGWNTSWPQYEISSSMADELADREFNVGEFYPITGKYISPLFLDYFHRHGGVRQFGYPWTNQMSEDGRPVQYFERNVMEYHADNPPEWRVLLRRLGAEEFQKRYR